MKQLKRFTGVTELLDEDNHALDQAECPHCKRRSPHGYYDPKTDPDAFIGWCECLIVPEYIIFIGIPDRIRRLVSEHVTFVFRCPNCLRLFWLHNFSFRVNYYDLEASGERLDPRVVEDVDVPKDRKDV